MASQGTVMAYHHKGASRKDQLGVHGKGIPKNSLTNEGEIKQKTLSDMSSRGSSSVVSSEDDDVASLDPFGVVSSVMNMNEALQKQIETLRLRIEVENKQRDEEKEEVVQNMRKEVESKEKEVCDLKDSLVNRDTRIKYLVDESRGKDSNIQSKMAEIEELKNTVKQTEEYAKHLDAQMKDLKEEKKKFESDDVYKKQKSEIDKLRRELRILKEKLGIMEKELQKAKKLIETQNSALGKIEIEKGDFHAKLKEELDLVQKRMRQEVERMREVMKIQYEEMKNLREQNKEMHSDVKDIRNLLLGHGPLRQQVNAVEPSGRSPYPAQPMTDRPGNKNKVQFQDQNIRASYPGGIPAQNNLPPIQTENSNKWIPSGVSKQTLSINTGRNPSSRVARKK